MTHDAPRPALNLPASVLPEPSRPPVLGRLLRLGWLALGCLCVVLGMVGALVPLMPTTIFLILAAACFARSFPRLERWLLDHPRFGPTLRVWRDKGAIGTRAKVMACAGLASGYIVFLVAARPSVILAVITLLLMGACAAFILSRPAVS